MRKKEIEQMTPLSGADVIERVRIELSAKTNGCLIGILVMLSLMTLINYAVIFAGDPEPAALVTCCILFGLVAFGFWIGYLVDRSREKKAAQHMIFRRYGGADSVAAVINAANGYVAYEDKKHQFRLTPTYIMAPGRYTTFMPTSHMLLACKEDRRAAAVMMMLLSPVIGMLMSDNKPTGLYLAAYNCYGDRVDYRFLNELTGGSAEIDRIVGMIQYYAPQCAVGDNMQTRAYLAMNTRMPPM